MLIGARTATWGGSKKRMITINQNGWWSGDVISASETLFGINEIIPWANGAAGVDNHTMRVEWTEAATVAQPVCNYYLFAEGTRYEWEFFGVTVGATSAAKRVGNYKGLVTDGLRINVPTRNAENVSIVDVTTGEYVVKNGEVMVEPYAF